MWVHDLAACDESSGNKAAHLARLIAAGLPVPAGFAIDTRAFRSIVDETALGDPETIGHALGAAARQLESATLPDALVREVDERARALGGSLVVRSSSTLEDAATGAAPGLFSSVVGVGPDELWAAVRSVWTSALAPIAASYARGKGPSAMGVVVQPRIEGELATVYTRPPGAPARDEIWLQRHGVVEKLARGALADDVAGRCGALALAAERAIDATASGADVELVIARDRIWVVQARPIPTPRVAARTAAPPIVLAPLEADGRVWKLDLAHNPEPLSPAQAGLVELVEAAGFAPWSMRVCAGYLYTAARDGAAIETIVDVADLERRATAIEARIQAVLAPTPADLEAALAQYLAFYRIWATELGPLVAAAKAGLTVDDLLGARPSAVEAILLAAARADAPLDEVRARLGALSPAWDVAVPTYDEEPHALAEALARIRIALAAQSPAVDSARVTLARAGADLAERDDFYFATAQWRVRRALLDRAAALQWQGTDVFWVPLDDVRAGVLGPVAARRHAAAGRGAHERASRWIMPAIVGGTTSEGPPLRGVGSGGSVTGQVCKVGGFAPTRIAISRHHVVVVRAVTPALAVLVAGAAALVSETGGLLDHGAAMARELGMPCVVGCRDAYSRLTDGQIVTVRGDEGVVEMTDR